ncbi:MAG: sulfotransferase [Methylococcales bacterium]
MPIDIESLLDEAYLLKSSLMYEPAIVKYNYILEHAADCDEALLMRGISLGKIGKVDEAIADIENAVLINDKDDVSFSMLAYLYVKKGDDLKAIKLCEQSLSLDASNADAIRLIEDLCGKYGDLMLKDSLFDRAEGYYQTALKYKKDNTSLLYKLVLVARSKGKINESISLAEQVIEIDPDHIRAKAHVASSYELLGELDKGNQLIENLIQEYPGHPLVIIVYAQYALRNKKQEKGIKILLNSISRENIQKDDMVSIKMLLGSLYDSVKQYDLAFKYFKQANDLLNENYDPDTYKDYISGLIDYFSKDKYQNIPPSDNRRDELIFIVGMPRSGTSLIEQVVSSHTKVFGAGELTHVYHLVDTMQTNEFSGVYPGCLDQANVSEMNALAEKLFNKISAENPGGTDGVKIIDKMPHNFHHIALLHKLFPNAKFINCIRDARDTCLSCYFQSFAGYHPYANDLNALAVHYRQYERLMRHWNDELQIPILTVSYKNIVSDMRNEVAIILKYLGLDWEEKCMEYYKRKRTAATASYNQVNKKIYTSSIDRWKNYEPYIGSLLSTLQEPYE